jgi:hypothetical protein
MKFDKEYREFIKKESDDYVNFILLMFVLFILSILFCIGLCIYAGACYFLNQ